MGWKHLLFAAGLVSSSIIPQIPIDCARPSADKFGWKGPGTYRLHTNLEDNVVALNESKHSIGITVKPPSAGDYTQRWTFAEVSKDGVYLILNNGISTGPVLSSNKDSIQTDARQYSPPYNMDTRWTLDLDTFDDTDGSPIE